MAVTTLLGTDTTTVTGSSNLELLNKVTDIEGSTTGGNYGIGAVLASSYNQELTTTSATTIVTFTPTTAGLFVVYTYFTVNTATTTTSLTITWHDPTAGSSSMNPVNTSLVVGPYNLVQPILADTSSAITVSMTVGTSNQVYATSVIIGY